MEFFRLEIHRQNPWLKIWPLIPLKKFDDWNEKSPTIWKKKKKKFSSNETLTQQVIKKQEESPTQDVKKVLWNYC